MRRESASNPMYGVLTALPPASEGSREDEIERLKRDRAIIALMEAANLPKKFSGIELGDVSRVPVDAAGDYDSACHRLLDVLHRPGIVALIGGRGPGKTTIGCGLIRECCRRLKSARYIDAVDYFIAVRETFGANAKATQSQVEAAHVRPFLLVIDELHERGDTPWEDRMLTRLINKRYAAELATVLISNQDKKAFAAHVGESVVDRIRDGGGLIICNWKSLRGRTQ